MAGDSRKAGEREAADGPSGPRDRADGVAESDDQTQADLGLSGGEAPPEQEEATPEVAAEGEETGETPARAGDDGDDRTSSGGA